MIEETETYLNISPEKFEIYLFDKKNLKNLYKEEKKLINNTNVLNLNILEVFLEENIFKIEKLIGKFVQNIFLIIDCNSTLNVSLGIKKKNYDREVNKKNLDSILIEAKDIFKERYQNQTIMHMLVNRYIVNGKEFAKIETDLISDYFCLEIKFISISNKLVLEINNVLQKYHIKIIRFIDQNYIINLFKDDNLEISNMINKMQNGYNENEVVLVPKNVKKKGIFEKFFQLFS